MTVTLLGHVGEGVAEQSATQRAVADALLDSLTRFSLMTLTLSARSALLTDDPHTDSLDRALCVAQVDHDGLVVGVFRQ